MKALGGALLELLEDKSFDQITIREITDRAGVSYPTFFRRFASKDELLERIATEEVRNLLRLGASAMSEQEDISSAHMCAYVQAHRTLWSTLLTGGAATAMREEFMRIAREMAHARPRANPWLPIDLAVPFVAGGIFEVLAWWMRQPEDYPIENVCTLLDALVIETTGRRRDITLK